MNSSAALAFLVVIALTYGAALEHQAHSAKPYEVSHDDEHLRNTGKALETLGQFLQGKVTGANESERKQIIEALTILVNPQPELEDGSDAYFFKAIKGFVRSITAEKVASVASG